MANRRHPGEHHVLFEKRLWNPHCPNQELRGKPGLLIPINHATHDALHREVVTVPAPNYLLGRAVLNAYQDEPDDHLRSVGNLLFAVQESIGPRVRQVERKLGELIIFSVEAQLPFIRAGIVDLRY